MASLILPAERSAKNTRNITLQIGNSKPEERSSRLRPGGGKSVDDAQRYPRSGPGAAHPRLPRPDGNQRDLTGWVAGPRKGADTVGKAKFDKPGWYWIEIRDASNSGRSPLPFRITREFVASAAK